MMKVWTERPTLFVCEGTCGFSCRRAHAALSGGTGRTFRHDCIIRAAGDGAQEQEKIDKA